MEIRQLKYFLAVAEQKSSAGAEGEDFLTLAEDLRKRVHGSL